MRTRRGGGAGGGDEDGIGSRIGEILIGVVRDHRPPGGGVEQFNMEAARESHAGAGIIRRGHVDRDQAHKVDRLDGAEVDFDPLVEPQGVVVAEHLPADPGRPLVVGGGGKALQHRIELAVPVEQRAVFRADRPRDGGRHREQEILFGNGLALQRRQRRDHHRDQGKSAVSTHHRGRDTGRAIAGRQLRGVRAFTRIYVD